MKYMLSFYFRWRTGFPAPEQRVTEVNDPADAPKALFPKSYGLLLL